MPRFQFQVRNESHVWLAEVVELAGADEARVEAARRVGDLLSKCAAKLMSDEEWRMDVTDDAGSVLFVIHIPAMTAATSGERAGG